MNEHLKLLEHLCFGPENYTNEKAYNKHLRTIAKQWDTTRELAPTINCAHCKFWEPKNKVDTKISNPVTAVDLNYNGYCDGLRQDTHGSQLCDLFGANPIHKIPKEFKRPFNNWGPKDNK